MTAADRISVTTDTGLTVLRSADLGVGQVASLAVSDDGRRAYVGRLFSDDHARENLVVCGLDPRTGAVLGKRLFRDSDRPLPPAFAHPLPSQEPSRPRSTVTTVLVAPRYAKLYLAAQLEDSRVRPAYFLTIYDLDDQGDPVASSVRSYRTAPDNTTVSVTLEAMALNPAANVLYMTGFGWPVVRYYQLDETGEPIGDAPHVVRVGNAASGKRAMAVNHDGTRLYLGTRPLRLEVVELRDGLPLVDGVPTVGGVPTIQPRQTITSGIPELGFGGDNYLRFVHTPRALFAARPFDRLLGGQPPHAMPLYALPFDDHGDVAPGVEDFRRLDGFDHVVLASDSARERIWLARETVAPPPAAAPVVDGIELVAYHVDAAGLPGALEARRPKLYAQQATLAAVAAGTGEPVIVTRPTQPVVDYVTGEQVRVRITRARSAPPHTPPVLQCRIVVLNTPLFVNFTVAEGALSQPLTLDSFLHGARGQVALWLTFSPAAPTLEWRIEVHYTPAEAPDVLVKVDTVRGSGLVFLLSGYASAPPEQRPESFELISERFATYRARAQSVGLDPRERPDQFVVSGYSMSGLQGHTGQLEDGLAALRALGMNSVLLASWGGIPAAELSERAADFSPETGVYGPRFGYMFDFLYDGSLVARLGGQPLDEAYLRDWARQQARAAADRTGLPVSRVVRFQLADEHAWYFPTALRWFDRVDPVTPNEEIPNRPDVKVDWRDATTKNTAWIRRFQDYLTLRDPDLAARLGEVVPIGASQAVDRDTHRLHYWSMRFFVDQAATGARRIRAALEDAFQAEPVAGQRPEHRKLHVHVNFGDGGEWQWHKAYPNAQGDNNPDRGPDAATGGFDWFDFAAAGMPLPFKTTYRFDAEAQVSSFWADLQRSAATPDTSQRQAAFGALVPGSRIGALPAGAAYKFLSLVARGAKILTAYAFEPQFFFAPPNSWADIDAAYAPVADAMRLIGRAERLLYPGKAEQGVVAIHLPAGSRLWDRHSGSTFAYREVLPLHTALVHDGYTVDFVDDRAIECGALRERGYTTLYLLGPNLGSGAQEALQGWVRGGGALVTLPGAATADEFNEPTTLLDSVLGLGDRAGWVPLREPAHMGTTWALSHRLDITDDDWRAALDVTEPVLLRRLIVAATPAVRMVDFPTLELAGAQTVATLAPASTTGPARPAITRHRYGEGTAYAYAFFPGWQYWCTATHPSFFVAPRFTDRLPRHWSTPDRLLATLPARLARTPRSVALSHAGVEARRMESNDGVAVVLFNWTGAPLPELQVTVRNVARFTHVRVSSVRRGALSGTVVEGIGLRVALPLDDVDVLLLEPQ